MSTPLNQETRDASSVEITRALVLICGQDGHADAVRDARRALDELLAADSS